MKVIDLRCQSGHRFEGWFASDDDFLDQNGRGLLVCPLCDDKVIVRMPSAPRLNLSGARRSETAPAVTASASPNELGDVAERELQARWLRAVRHVVQNTEDVGERFTDEARRIHHGDAPERGIRGQATPQQREALRDEGIEVHALPLPLAVKDGGLH